MTDPKSEKFKRDNIYFLEEIKVKFSLHADLFLTNLLYEWQSVESINFTEIPEDIEHRYENPGLIANTPNYNRTNTPTPVHKYIQDDISRPPVLPPRVETRPLPNPLTSGSHSPVLPPAYANTVIRNRDPYPNYSDKNRPWPHKENIEIQHGLNKDRFPQQTVQIIPTFESKVWNPEIDPMGIFAESNTIMHESPPKFDDVDKFNVKEDRPPFPPPYRPDYYPPSDTIGQPMRAKRSHSVDILNSKPEIPPRSAIDTTTFNSDRRLEPKPGDPEYANCVDTYAHKHSRNQVSSEIHRTSEFTPVDPLMHRPNPVDTQMHRPLPSQVVQVDNQIHRPNPVIPDPLMHRASPVIPVDTQMHRPLPSQVVQVDQMHRPSQPIPMDSQMHRPPSAQVVQLDPQMHRPIQALPVDIRSTGAMDIHTYRQTGIPVTSDLHRPSGLIAPKYNTGPRMHMKEYDGAQPLKTTDDYLVMFAHSDEESKDTQQQAEGMREDSSMGVFNLKEMISERTETVIDEQGYRRRKVIMEKTSSQEEANFYDTISNHSVFYLYLTEHNILTQEVLSLEHPIGTVLTEKLAPYYSLNLSNSIITLGAQVGLLEVNDRVIQGSQKLEAFLKMFTGKRKVPLDPYVSLHQISITTSHVICISQQNANFDENSYNFYLEKREENLVESFHRSFIPFVQGAIPLKKVNVKNLISYLGVIYKLTDWEKMIPDVYKKDPEMNAHIEPSIKLCFESSPDEVMPQVISLAQESRLRESIYFYVKINNKIDKKSKDSVLGINKRNIHLLSMTRNCEIEIATMWSSVDIETWTVPANKEIVIKFKNESRLQLVSPEHSEDMIHKMLKSGIKCKVLLDIK